MEFGICFDTHIDKWDLIRYVEELGYDRAWVPDSQMIWSDCYATMALAAQATKRIKIGTGVAIPGTRIAPVTAHSIRLGLQPLQPCPKCGRSLGRDDEPTYVNGIPVWHRNCRPIAG